MRTYTRARKLAALLLLSSVALGVCDPARAEESLGHKIKRILAPTPTPTPRKHRKRSATPKASATPENSSPDTVSVEKPRKSSPTPALDSSTPSASQSPTSAEAEPGSSPSSSPGDKKRGAPATIEQKEIRGYEDYPLSVRKIIDTALDLTRQSLDYTYGSADPANGGMDCSGFVFYVLTQNGIHDAPRDSSQQYVWLRKAGTFRAVNSRREDTFELDELTPGDLLFWTGTYNADRDPPITHAMIYLGREKGTNQRIMVGASDGRTYRGESRYGVSVFDFKIPKPGKTDEGRTSPTFIGYGHIPGL